MPQRRPGPIRTPMGAKDSFDNKEISRPRYRMSQAAGDPAATFHWSKPPLARRVVPDAEKRGDSGGRIEPRPDVVANGSRLRASDRGVTFWAALRRSA